jgi:AmmeMemoRadiSam system protein A
MSGDTRRADDTHAAAPPPDGGTESLTSARTDGARVPALARRAVETFVRERLVLDAGHVPDLPIFHQRAACFVSIKTTGGDLRGCIGTIEPARRTLGREIVMNAVQAATQDPRFNPVQEHELSFLRYSVDVLSEPEPTQFADLDPSLYGVIVQDRTGTRRGLLLPDIEGVETSAQQVQIAARKAGIMPDEPLRLFRFQVIRFRESRKHISSD